jgi:hypothetical protein
VVGWSFTPRRLRGRPVLVAGRFRAAMAYPGPAGWGVFTSRDKSYA